MRLPESEITTAVYITYNHPITLIVLSNIQASIIGQWDILPTNKYKKYLCIPRTLSEQSIASSTLAAKADLSMSRILR